MGGAGVGVCSGDNLEGEGMRLVCILLIAFPLVVCAAVCDVCEWILWRARR